MPFYANNKVDGVDYIAESDLEAIESGFAQVEGALASKRGNEVLVLQGQEAQGVGGGAGTSGAFVSRDLSTAVVNTIVGASLASASSFYLPSGSYAVEFSAPAFRVDGHQCRLFQQDAGETGGFNLLGSSEFASYDNEAQTVSIGRGLISTVGSASNEIYLLHQIERASLPADNALGRPANIGAEVYAQIIVWKLT